jgi:glycosyltransferase involved in cell wall biosynthesis
VAQAASLSSPLPKTGGNSIRLVLVGSLVERKGHRCAIEAVALLKAMEHFAVLFLPGFSEDEQAKRYQRDLAGLVADRDVADRVHFIGWRRDMPAVIKACDVAILPSADEGFPLALVEAMVLERPVISTPVGGIPDLIKPGETGWLHDADDYKALAECILAAHDPAKREPIVLNALQHVRSNFSPERQRELALQAFAAAVEVHDVPERRTPKIRR